VIGIKRSFLTHGPFARHKKRVYSYTLWKKPHAKCHAEETRVQGIGV